MNIINALLFQIAVLFLGGKYKVPSVSIIYMAALFFMPFISSYIILPDGYAPDQIRYVDQVNEYRANIFNANLDKSNSVVFSSLILAIIPIPFFNDNISLGLVNVLILCLTYIWIYKNKFFQKNTLTLLIVYPSIIFYASLALKDTLILILMLFFIIGVIKKKFFLALFCLFILALIKFFSAILLIPLLIFFILTSYSNKNFTFFIFYAVWIFGLVFALFFLLEELNSLRLSFYFENYNTDYGFVEISNLYQLIIEVSGALRKFFFSPNIFEVKNMFEFAQSFENIIIFMVLIFYFVRSFKINSRYAFFFLMLLFTFSIAYGLVVFNIGTLCRYKFPIIFTIIAAISMVDSKEFWGYSE